jgi:hypothetical protein
MRAEVKGGKDAEDRQRDDLLNHFELDHAEAAVAKAVGWNLEAVLKEGDAPADEDDLPEGVLTEFQVAVPGKVMKMLEKMSRITVHISDMDAHSVERVAAKE